MAAVTNKELEESMMGLFAAMVTVLQDYNEHKKNGESYDVNTMSKRYESFTMKEFKKWPGGETQLYANIIEFMQNFNVSEYYKLVREPIMDDLINYLKIT